MIVEIACNSFTSCLNAEQNGADRIELFENLGEGGCTPSAGTIKKALQLSIPVYVMIRPRGGDFTYSNDEIDIMLSDIEFCKNNAVKGIVFGCLNSKAEVDIPINKLLMDAWNGPATFHRAIDRSADIMKACHTIIDLGFERILSSGGQADAIQGIPTLRNMISQLSSLITIIPGAGINISNAAELIKETACKEIHSTCKAKHFSANAIINSMEDYVYESDAELIDNLCKLVKNL